MNSETNISTASILEVCNLHVGYNGREVLRGVDLSVAKGESIALIGPNGCGKSTLFKAIIGMLHPVNGYLKIANQPVKGIPVEERCHLGVGYLWQTTNIFPALTVSENINLAAMGGRQSKEYIDERKKELLNTFSMLKNHLSKRAGLLSGGEKQALAISMVLMRPAKILLLDEPVAALSQNAGAEILDALTVLQHENGFATIIVEHRLRQIQPYVNRTIVMQNGQLVADTPDTGLMTDVDWLHKVYTATMLDASKG